MSAYHDPGPSDGLELQQRANDMIERCLLAQRRTKQQLVFGMLTALTIHGIEFPHNKLAKQHRKTVFAIARNAASRTNLKGVVFRVWTHPMDTIHLDCGIEVTDVFTTLMQVAQWCTRIELTVLFDLVQRRQHALLPTFCRDVANFLEITGLLRGKANIRWALAHTRANTDSSMETRLRLALTVKGRLPEPVINFRLQDNDSYDFWYLDLSYPKLKIAIEYQGGTVHSSSDQVRRDSNKITRLQLMGWICLTISVQHLNTEQSENTTIDWIRNIRKTRKHAVSARRRAQRALTRNKKTAVR